jgi:dTDP-4-dehydrorhamnose 3,5-epimerase-like enzyme
VARQAGIDPAVFVQDMRCSFGAVFDVIVDLRPGSVTYRNWESFELRDADRVFSVSDRIIAAPVSAFRS